MKMNPNAGGEEASSDKVGHEHGVLTLNERLGEIPGNRIETTGNNEPSARSGFFETGLICNPGNGEECEKTDDEGEGGGEHRDILGKIFLSAKFAIVFFVFFGFAQTVAERKNLPKNILALLGE